MLPHLRRADGYSSRGQNGMAFSYNFLSAADILRNIPIIPVPTVDALAYNLYGTEKIICL